MEEIFLKNPSEEALETPDLGLYQDDTSISNNISQEDSRINAEKIHFALGDNSPNPEEIWNRTSNGEEETFRKDEEIKQAAKDMQTREALLQDYLATRGTGPVTDVEYEYFNNLTSKKGLDITQDSYRTFFERQYAKRFTDIAKTTPDTAVADLVEQFPELGEDLSNKTSLILTNQEIFKRISQEYDQKVREQHPVTNALEFIGTLVPFVTPFVRSGAVEGVASSIIPGKNSQEQFQYLYSLPPEEAEKKAREALKNVEFYSLLEAAAFAKGMISYSNMEDQLDNLLPLLDVVPYGEVALRGGKALRNIIKTNATTSAGTTQQILNTTGQAHSAALNQSLQNIRDKATALAGRGSRPNQSQTSWDTLLNSLPSIANPQQITASPGSFNSVAASNLETFLTERSNANISSLILNDLKTQRLENNIVSQGYRETAELAFEELSRASRVDINRVVNSIEPIKAEDNIFGIESLRLNFGDKNALPFPNKDKADYYAKNILGLPEYTITELDNGTSLISVIRNVDETTTSIREGLKNSIDTKNKFQTPTSTFRTLFSYFTGASEASSKRLNEASLAATLGSSKVVNLAKETFQSSFEGISKKGRKEVLEVIDSFTSREISPETIADFETEFFGVHNKVPTFEQTRAYFGTKQFHDTELLFNNLAVMKEKARLGLREHRILRGRQALAEGVEGKELQEFPWNIEGRAGVLVVGDDLKDHKVLRKHAMNKEKIDKLIRDEGYKVIQITEKGEDALRNADEFSSVLDNKAPVRFVLSKTSNSTNLSFSQIPKKPGFHVQYRRGHFIKQAKFSSIKEPDGSTTTHYRGDNVLVNVMTPSQGKRFVDDMEAARSLFLNGDKQALRAFINRKLPYTYSQFIRLFKGKNAIFDINEPFILTLNDQNVSDVMDIARTKPNVVFDKDDPFNLTQTVAARFTQERQQQVKMVRQQGTQANPYFTLSSADLVDPLQNSATNMRVIMNGHYMDDLKIKNAEQFAAEFSDYFDLRSGITKEDILRNPLRALTEAKFKNVSDVKDANKLFAAKAFRRRALELFNHKSDHATLVTVMKQKLANEVMERVGEKGFRLVEPWLLHKETNPAKFLKQVVFHSKLGLFNIPQLFVQAQTWTHIAGLEGFESAASSGTAAGAMRMVRAWDTPQNLDAIADKVSKATLGGFKKEEFIESYQAMKSVGWDVVGNEYAVIDDIVDPKLITGKVDQFLEAGTTFFKEGERYVRMTAWNAAYRSWRRAHPNVKLNNKAKLEILSRADLLSVNMTRASNASWQKGLAGVPTQFFAYQARLTEQMLGRRLSGKDRLRLFTMYSAMYGMPIGAGIFSNSFLPVNEMINRGLLEMGVDYDDNVVNNFLGEGLFDTAIQLAFGADTNIEERLGPGGNSSFYDLLYNDDSFLEALQGASGTTLGSMLNAAYPIASGLANIAVEGSMNVTSDDVLNLLRQASSVNSATNLYKGLTAGKYYTKDGRLADRDVDNIQSLFMGILGTTPDNFNDAMLMINSKKRLKEAQKEAGKEAGMYIRRSLNTNDPETIAENWRRANLALDGLGFTLREKNRIIKQAIGEDSSLVESVTESFVKLDPETRSKFLKKVFKDINE